MRFILKFIPLILFNLYSYFSISQQAGSDQSSYLFSVIFSAVVFLWLATEIPLFVSGLLGVCASIMLGLSDAKSAFAPFAHPIIFLFMGGFLLAQALENTSLDKIIADKVLSLKSIYRSPKKILFAFLAISFVLSMWISNTATVALLIPLTFGVIALLEKRFDIKNEKFNESFLLALAFCATIGGSVTPIGSPPNAVAVGFLKTLAGSDLDFFSWMVMALPLSGLLFLLTYYLLIRKLPNAKTAQIHLPEKTKLSLSREQKIVFITFISMLFAWIAPSLAKLFLDKSSALYQFFTSSLNSSVVAIGFTSLLFIFPLKAETKILTQNSIKSIDWPSLLLFGSGLSLGKIMFDCGLAKILAENISTLLDGSSNVAFVSIIVLFTILFTELASNTASANILIPIMMAIGQQMNMDLNVLAFILALSCNSAFMLPVATPPNAIIYGTNRVSKREMMKQGALLNLASWLLFTVYIFLKI